MERAAVRSVLGADGQAAPPIRMPKRDAAAPATPVRPPSGVVASGVPARQTSAERERRGGSLRLTSSSADVERAQRCGALGAGRRS
jgi:hypothetical protein